MAKTIILIVVAHADPCLLVNAWLATWPRFGATSSYGTAAKRRMKRFACVEGDGG